MEAMESDFVQYKRKEKTDPWYGLEVLNITKDDIEHLMRGGKLYYTDGEYAYEIMMQDVNTDGGKH